MYESVCREMKCLLANNNYDRCFVYVRAMHGQIMLASRVCRIACSNNVDALRVSHYYQTVIGILKSTSFKRTISRCRSCTPYVLAPMKHVNIYIQYVLYKHNNIASRFQPKASICVVLFVRQYLHVSIFSDMSHAREYM